MISHADMYITDTSCGFSKLYANIIELICISFSCILITGKSCFHTSSSCAVFERRIAQRDIQHLDNTHIIQI